MEIDILGKKRPTSLTIGAIKIYCQETGVSLIDFAASMNKMDVNQFEILIYAAMMGGCQRDKVQPDFTLEDVKNEIDSWPFERIKELLEVFLALANDASSKNVKAPESGAN